MLSAQADRHSSWLPLQQRKLPEISPTSDKLTCKAGAERAPSSPFEVHEPTSSTRMGQQRILQDERISNHRLHALKS